MDTAAMAILFKAQLQHLIEDGMQGRIASSKAGPAAQLRAAAFIVCVCLVHKNICVCLKIFVCVDWTAISAM